MSDGFWVVAQTKPQQERWAAENVARQGYRWYLPLTLERPKPGSHKGVRRACLFPRYLFVWTEGRWHSLRNTYGVIGVIMNGQIPSIVPEKAVEEIRRREGQDGLIHLENAPLERFKVGAPIRVTDGVFSGYEGIFLDSSKERCRVLLEFLGRKASVFVSDDVLEAV